jgi:hypothetical protein
VVDPVLKATDPEGVLTPGDVTATVADRVTVWPTTAPDVAETEVVVASFVTVRVVVVLDEVVPLVVAGTYVAFTDSVNEPVNGWVQVATSSVATLSSVPEQMVVPAWVKFTVPEGMADWSPVTETFEVKVTVWPTTGLAGLVATVVVVDGARFTVRMLR